MTITKIKLHPRSQLTAKVRTGFAGSIEAGNGVVVSHAGNVYVVGVDPTQIPNFSVGLPFTLGDTFYAMAATSVAKVAGNTTTTRKFWSQTGTGAASAAPAWNAISASDLPFSGIVINVKDPPYNATGDGSTDDTTAVSAARAALQAAGGGILWFPKGTYIIGTDAALSFSTGHVTMAGVRGASIIKAKDSVQLGQLIGATSAVSSMTIRDIVIDGNRDNSGIAQSTTSYCVAVLCSHFSMEGVEVRNVPRIGLAFFDDPEYISLDRCYFHDIGVTIAQALDANVGTAVFGGICNIFRVTNSDFIDIHSTVSPIGDSTALNAEATNQFIDGNYFLNCLNVTGGQTGIAGAGSSYAVFSNNIVEQTSTFGSESTTGVGIDATGGKVIVTGNITRGATADGISVTGTPDLIIISHNIVEGFGNCGVNLLNAPTWTLISNNIFYDGPTGISVQGGGTGVVATDNVFRSVTTSYAPGSGFLQNFGNLGTAAATAGAVSVASTGVLSSGTLSAANGGTGQPSYSIGDILYAQASTTLAKLNAVATGNALISGGVTTAPSWGKIGLTTHVSGTLPVANGGTGITSFGSGVATFLGTPSSANLATAVTDETGSGALVFATSPTLVTPALGVATATSINGVSLDANAWTSYSPTATPSSGAFTTHSVVGRSSKRGRVVHFWIALTITTNGSAAGFISITLPFNIASLSPFALSPCSAYDANTNTFLLGIVGGNGVGTIALTTLAGAYPGADGRTLILSGTYESAS